MTDRRWEDADELHRYCIRYRDMDPCCPTFTWRCNAYNKEHALAQFWKSSPDPDWHIIRVDRYDNASNRK